MGLRLPLDRAERIREGPCPRCGWKSDLHRSGQHDGGARPDTSYRWLCVECATDLKPAAGSVGVPEYYRGWTARWRNPIGART